MSMIARFVLLISFVSVLLSSVLISMVLLIGQTQHGRELAFVRDEGGSFNFNIYLMDIDRGLTMPVTNRALWYDDFEWSPDGQHIAVELVTRDTQDLIYLLDMQGEVSLLTQGQQPRWSPDGRTLAYLTRGTIGCHLALLEVTLEDPQVTCVSSLANAMPRWSPDGQSLAYLVGMDTRQIFVADAQRRELPRRITIGTEIVWSPDSQTLIYTAYRDNGYDMYAMNLNTGVEQTLTNTIEDERYPVWSPDGTRLAFVATYGYADFLRILHPDGFVSNIDLTELIGRRVYVGEPPVWSPDGTQLVLSLITPSVPNAYSLYIVTLGNGVVNIRRLTGGGHSELHPAWRP